MSETLLVVNYAQNGSLNCVIINL